MVARASAPAWRRPSRIATLALALSGTCAGDPAGRLRLRPLDQLAGGGSLAEVGAGGSEVPAQSPEGPIQPTVPPPASSLVPVSELPLSVSGRHVIGKTGKRVRLHCVNWYGAQLEQMVNNGLDRQPLPDIAALIARLGFNCIRLPFTLELVLANRTQVPDPRVSLAANPELQGLSPLAVLDRTITALTSVGLLVVLNIHSSSAGWCCSNEDGEGLWWTEKYPEEDWLQVMSMMAGKYRNNSLVAAFDLRNEVRPSKLGTPQWGTGDPKTDWAIAAVKGGKAVLAENPDMLIIISGLTYGMFLCDVPRQPVHVSVPELRGRALYTTHDYPWYHFRTLFRGWLSNYLVGACVVCAAVFTVLTAEWLLQRYRARTGGHLTRWISCCNGLRCAELELAMALLLVAAALICARLGESWLYQCGDFKTVAAMAAFGLAIFSAFASCVVWVRVAVACTQRAHRVLLLRLGRYPAGDQATEVELNGGAEGLARQVAVQPPEAAAPRRGRKRRACALFLLSTRCLLMALACVVLSSLGILWYDYGTYDTFRRELDRRWNIERWRAASDAAPIWVSEFGTDVRNDWWRYIVRYLEERDLDWAYWAINGEKSIGQPETYGLLNADSKSIRHPWKMEDLERLLLHGSSGT